MSAFTKEFVMELAEKAGLEPRLWNYTDAFERFFELAVTAEREACAKICDTTPPEPFRPSIEDAHAIRARGEA